jgi:hypothetical protein
MEADMAGKAATSTAGKAAGNVSRVTTTTRPMSQKATRITDSAVLMAAIKTGSGSSGELDILAGPSDGSAGLYRFSLAAKPLMNGGLRLEIEVPAQLARPARDLVEALRAGRYLS